MPTLEDYFEKSQQYDMDDLDRIPEDVQDEINAQLEHATVPDGDEPVAK